MKLIKLTFHGATIKTSENRKVRANENQLFIMK